MTTPDPKSGDYWKEHKKVEAAVANELAGATLDHGCFQSRHEALGVIREEYREMEDEVFKKKADPEKLAAELVQLAAMAERALIDLDLVGYLR